MAKHLYCPDIATDLQMPTSNTARRVKCFRQILSSSKLLIKNLLPRHNSALFCLVASPNAPAERYTVLKRGSSLGDWLALSFSGFCPECGFFRLEDLIHLGPNDPSLSIAHTLAIHRAYRADFKPCRREPYFVG